MEEKEKHNRIFVWECDGEFVMPGFSLHKYEVPNKIADFVIPYPNIISSYLNISDAALKRAKNISNQLLEGKVIYNKGGNFFEFEDRDSIYKLFDYFEETMTSIVFSYTAVEAVCNNLLPNDFEVEIEKNGKTIKIDKNYIEKKFVVSEKIKKFILNYYEVTIDFNKVNFWIDFTTLEFYRNELVHLKSDRHIINSLGAREGSNNTRLLSSMHWDTMKLEIIQSARKLIKLLVNATKVYNGMPREFQESNPKYVDYFRHFQKEENYKIDSRLLTKDERKKKE